MNAGGGGDALSYIIRHSSSVYYEATVRTRDSDENVLKRHGFCVRWVALLELHESDCVLRLRVRNEGDFPTLADKIYVLLPVISMRREKPSYCRCIR